MFQLLIKVGCCQLFICETIFILTYLFKPFQVVAVVVVAVVVVTTVTQEGAEAHGAAGFGVHTEDVIPLFQSILTFVSRLRRPHLLG